jgi:hypothetical protein
MSLRMLCKGFNYCLLVSAFSLVAVPTANALTQDISAVFRPDPAKPTENGFINTTPVSGYCAQYPAECNATKMFSIRLPVSFSSTGPIQANHTDPRQGATLKVPANWRSVSVVNSSTGETEVVEIRVSGIGSRYTLSNRAVDLVGGGDLSTAHDRLWGSSWIYVPSPCQYSGVGYYTPLTYGFFWKTPSEGYCSKQAKYLIPSMNYDYLDFAYELRTPNPLKMSTGNYTGTLTYSVGPGRDFDMGDVMVANDSAITLNFNLEVQHTLKVEIPPGGNRIELEPQGGWQAWLNQGQKPTRLFRDQLFYISASTRFKMTILCAHWVSGLNCAVKNGSKYVEINTYVTLPAGLVDSTGGAINRRFLQPYEAPLVVQPGSYIDRKPGTLHFEISQSGVAQMLDSGGGNYYGGIMVIWDSEIN